MSMANHKHNFGETIDAQGGYAGKLMKISYYEIDNAALATATAVHAAVTLGEAAQDVTTAITSPAVARNVAVKGNAAGIAGDVVFTGTNMADEVITETIALSGADSVVGNKAFKTVTKITLPIETHVGTDTVSIGTGAKLGLPYKLSHAGQIYKAYMAGTEETIAASTQSATAVESNTITTTTALDGTKDLDFILFVM